MEDILSQPYILIPLLLSLILCLFLTVIKQCCNMKPARRLGNRDHLGTIRERMKRKLFMAYGDLLDQMSEQDNEILRETYNNTIENANIKIIKPTSTHLKTNPKKKKRVLFVDECDQTTLQCEQSTLIQ